VHGEEVLKPLLRQIRLDGTGLLLERTNRGRIRVVPAIQVCDLRIERLNLPAKFDVRLAGFAGAPARELSDDRQTHTEQRREYRTPEV
jgi:hypothetical protein